MHFSNIIPIKSLILNPHAITDCHFDCTLGLRPSPQRVPVRHVTTAVDEFPASTSISTKPDTASTIKQVEGMGSGANSMTNRMTHGVGDEDELADDKGNVDEGEGESSPMSAEELSEMIKSEGSGQAPLLAATVRVKPGVMGVLRSIEHKLLMRLKAARLRLKKRTPMDKFQLELLRELKECHSGSGGSGVLDRGDVAPYVLAFTGRDSTI